MGASVRLTPQPRMVGLLRPVDGKRNGVRCLPRDVRCKAPGRRLARPRASRRPSPAGARAHSVVSRSPSTTLAPTAGSTPPAIPGGGRRPGRSTESPRAGRASSAVVPEPRSAVVVAEARHPDLAVVEVGVTPYGAFGITRDIKASPETTCPVVVVLERPQDDWLARWSGADALVNRPIDPFALAEVARRLVEEHRGVVPAMEEATS